MEIAERKPRYKVDDDTGCWNWTGCFNSDGYGVSTFGEFGRPMELSENARLVYAHRLSYWFKYGRIGKGFEIDHLCRNRSCVNPDHLQAVTRRTNVRRGKSAKLNEQKVAEIRLAVATGKDRKELAEQYKVSLATIYRVTTGDKNPTAGIRGLWSDVPWP